MRKIEHQAARLNMWTALMERTGRVVDALGGWQVVAPVAIFMAGAWGALVRWLDQLPFAVVAAAALILTALTANAFVALRRAWAIRGLKRLDLTVLAGDLIKFREEAFEFLLSRQEAFQAGNPPEGNISPEQMHREWERRRDFSLRTSALAAQKFAHRAVALVHLLSQANIPPPSLWAFDHELPNIATHFGAIGELLQRGLLEEARAMTDFNEHRVRLYLG